VSKHTNTVSTQVKKCTFWYRLNYQREKSFNAGIITALTNRLGDVGLLVIIGCLFRMGSFSYLFLRSREIRFSSINVG
jgi:hypothetical protein